MTSVVYLQSFYIKLDPKYLKTSFPSSLYVHDDGVSVGCTFNQIYHKLVLVVCLLVSSRSSLVAAVLSQIHSIY